MHEISSASLIYVICSLKTIKIFEILITKEACFNLCCDHSACLWLLGTGTFAATVKTKFGCHYSMISPEWCVWIALLFGYGQGNWFHPYPSGLLHWHWGNHMITWGKHMIAPVPVKQPWRKLDPRNPLKAKHDYNKTYHDKTLCIYLWDILYQIHWNYKCQLVARQQH